MGAVRASQCVREAQFVTDLRALQSKYPKVDAAIDEFCETLVLDYELPRMLVSPKTLPNVYAHRIDYPPLGEAGLGRFLVTYHATDPAPSPKTPYRTFTLLTISERNPTQG